MGVQARLCFVDLLADGARDEQKSPPYLDLLSCFCNWRIDQSRELIALLEDSVDYIQRLRSDPAARDELQKKLEERVKERIAHRSKRYREKVLEHVSKTVQDWIDAVFTHHVGEIFEREKRGLPLSAVLPRRVRYSYPP